MNKAYLLHCFNYLMKRPQLVLNLLWGNLVPSPELKLAAMMIYAFAQEDIN